MVSGFHLFSFIYLSWEEVVVIIWQQFNELGFFLYSTDYICPDICIILFSLLYVYSFILHYVLHWLFNLLRILTVPERVLHFKSFLPTELREKRSSTGSHFSLQQE